MRADQRKARTADASTRRCLPARVRGGRGARSPVAWRRGRPEPFRFGGGRGAWAGGAPRKSVTGVRGQTHLKSAPGPFPGAIDGAAFTPDPISTAPRPKNGPPMPKTVPKKIGPRASNLAPLPAGQTQRWAKGEGAEIGSRTSLGNDRRRSFHPGSDFETARSWEPWQRKTDRRTPPSLPALCQALVMTRVGTHTHPARDTRARQGLSCERGRNSGGEFRLARATVYLAVPTALRRQGLQRLRCEG